MASPGKAEDVSSTRVGEPCRDMGISKAMLRHFEELDKRWTAAKEECELAEIERRKSGPTQSRPTPGHFKPGSPWPPTHWEEIIKLQKRLSDILHDSDDWSCRPTRNGRRVSPEDEVVVRDVLKYLRNSNEKIGPGIDHIKIKRTCSGTAICFWMVRVDGTEIDFSYHKCLKDKAAKECPDMLPYYDALFINGIYSFLVREIAIDRSGSPKQLDKNANDRAVRFNDSTVEKETVY